MGDKISKIIIWIIMIFFLGIVPLYVIYDIIDKSFIEKIKSVKIEKKDFITLDEQENNPKQTANNDKKNHSKDIAVNNNAGEIKKLQAKQTIKYAKLDPAIFTKFPGMIKIMFKVKSKPVRDKKYWEERRRKDKLLEQKLDSIARENRKYARKLKGEKLTILITGVDSRLGSDTKHADANHLVNIYFDTGFIEIISVPRGTLADAGFEDSTENYLANVRSHRGHRIYMQEIKRISGIKKIDFYVEFGFSEAMGLLDLLGYNGNSVQVLRMLRHRKSFPGGDVQRCYNQGQFIRQMILGFFPIMQGVTGDVILRGALYLVDTDLDLETAKKIIKRLRSVGFPASRNDVIVHVKPKYRSIDYKFDFTDSTSRDSLYNRLSHFAERIGLDEKPHDSRSSSDIVYERALGLIGTVKSDSGIIAEDVISTLKRPFDQKIWLQIQDSARRAEIRNEIGKMLYKSYRAKNLRAKADSVRIVITEEEKLLHPSIKR